MHALKYMQVEPKLQPITITGGQFHHVSLNVEDSTHLNISMNGFWGGKFETDVKVFNPHAPSKSSSITRAIYRRRENMKKLSYEAQICEIEHASFIPLIFCHQSGG